MLSNLIISKNAWEYAESSLVPHLLISVESVLLRKEDPEGIFPFNGRDDQDSVLMNSLDEVKPLIKGSLKFSVSCQIISVFLWKTSSNKNIGSSDDRVLTTSKETFCASVVTKIFPSMLTVISLTNDDAEREHAMKLLPSLFNALQKLSPSISKGLV